MKLIVAIVHLEKLKAVLTTLNGREVRLLAVGEVLSPERGAKETCGCPEIPRTWIRVEVASNDSATAETVQAIIRANGSAGAGQAMGNVFVTRLEEYVELSQQDRESIARNSNSAHGNFPPSE
jgi:nitrogen regulatory protein PII